MPLLAFTPARSTRLRFAPSRFAQRKFAYLRYAPFEVRPFEVRPFEVRQVEVRVGEARPFEVRPSKVRPSKVCPRFDRVAVDLHGNDATSQPAGLPEGPEWLGLSAGPMAAGEWRLPPLPQTASS